MCVIDNIIYNKYLYSIYKYVHVNCEYSYMHIKIT